MQMLENSFFEHMTAEKHASANTISSYRRDLNGFFRYLYSIGITKPEQVTPTHIDEYLRLMSESGKKAATIARCASSIKSFYRFLGLRGVISANPARVIRSISSKRSLPNVLSGKEIDLLLSQPSGDTEKEIRDRAMLELLYATGLRVSELTNLNIQDLNCEIGFIRCRGDKEGRIIPLYQKACELLSRYCTLIRPMLVYGSDEPALFVNLAGERLSRQGFWKIVKSYANSAGISKTITPQTLRHSFALHLLENGADIRVLSNMMGHADVSSTQIYNEIIRRKINSSYTNYHPHAAK